MLVALTILATVLVSIAGVLNGFVKGLNRDAQRARATDLVVTRLESLKGISRYDAIDAQARTESGIDGYPGFMRITMVRRVNTSQNDYKVVTVKAVGRYRTEGHRPEVHHHPQVLRLTCEQLPKGTTPFGTA